MTKFRVEDLPSYRFLGGKEPEVVGVVGCSPGKEQQSGSECAYMRMFKEVKSERNLGVETQKMADRMLAARLMCQYFQVLKPPKMTRI